jgi:hypothetical protein
MAKNFIARLNPSLTVAEVEKLEECVHMHPQNWLDSWITWHIREVGTRTSSQLRRLGNKKNHGDLKEWLVKQGRKTLPPLPEGTLSPEMIKELNTIRWHNEKTIEEVVWRLYRFHMAFTALVNDYDIEEDASIETSLPLKIG